MERSAPCPPLLNPPAAKLLAIGVPLVVAQVLLIRMTRGLNHDTAAAFSAVAPLIALLGIPTAALLLVGRTLGHLAPTRAALLIVISCGVLMRLVWFGSLPPLEDDYFRYVWDGAVLAHGLDPYAIAPGHVFHTTTPPVYQRLGALPAAAEVLQRINFPDVRSIYPSVAQAAFALAHWLRPFDVDGLRIVLLSADLVTLTLLLALLQRLGRSPLWSALYWWNPLPATLLVGLGHVDALIPPFVLGGVLAMVGARPMWAVALFALGAGVKIWPLLLVPVVLVPMRHTPRRLVAAAALAILVLLMAIGPVVVSSLKPGSGLTAYATSWSNNNALFAWTAHGLCLVTGACELAATLLRAMLGVGVWAIALALAYEGKTTVRAVTQNALIISTATFYLSPAQFPWYAVWFLPFAAALQNWPLLLASATLPTYYLFFPLWPIAEGIWYFYGTAFLHVVPVAVCALWLKRQRRTDPWGAAHAVPATSPHP